MQHKILFDYISQYVPLTTVDWDMLKDNLVVKNYKKKEKILQEGQVCRYIYFVETGAIRVYETAKTGKEISVFFALNQAFFTNYASFLSQKAGIQTIQAIEDTKIIAFPYETVQKGYDCSKNWERFGRLMAEQIFMAEMKRRTDLQKQTYEERYHYILKEYPQWLNEIPLHYLASYIGMTKESLSRIRARK